MSNGCSCDAAFTFDASAQSPSHTGSRAGLIEEKQPSQVAAARFEQPLEPRVAFLHIAALLFRGVEELFLE